MSEPTYSEYIDRNESDEISICNCGKKKDFDSEMCEDCKNAFSDFENYLILRDKLNNPDWLIVTDSKKENMTIEPFLLRESCKFEPYKISEDLKETIWGLFWNFQYELKHSGDYCYLIIENEIMFEKLKLM